MGAVCSKQKTHKIIISQSKSKQLTPKPDEQEYEPIKLIGQEFQLAIESTHQNCNKRNREWAIQMQSIAKFKSDEYYDQFLYEKHPDIVEFDKMEQDDLDLKSSTKKRQNTHNIKLNGVFLQGKFKCKQVEILDMCILKEINPTKFSSLLKLGSTAKFRWNAWMAQIYNNNLYDPELYQQLLSKQDANNEDSIKKDIFRTFPKHQYFGNEQSPGCTQLFKVLKALCLQYPPIGYTQGMNYVAAFALIMSNGNEEQSFWFIHFLTQDPRYMLLDIYKVYLATNKQPLFQYSKILTNIFIVNFHNQLPALFEHFENNMFTDQQYFWKWLTTLFLYTFPQDAVVYFWDFIIATNIFSIISLSLSILQNYGSTLIDMDMEGLSIFFSNISKFQYIVNCKDRKYNLDLDEIIREAIKFNAILDFTSSLQTNCQYSEVIKNGFQFNEEKTVSHIDKQLFKVEYID